MLYYQEPSTTVLPACTLFQAVVRSLYVVSTSPASRLLLLLRL